MSYGVVFINDIWIEYLLTIGEKLILPIISCFLIIKKRLIKNKKSVKEEITEVKKEVQSHNEEFDYKSGFYFLLGCMAAAIVIEVIKNNKEPRKAEVKTRN